MEDTPGAEVIEQWEKPSKLKLTPSAMGRKWEGISIESKNDPKKEGLKLPWNEDVFQNWKV